MHMTNWAIKEHQIGPHHSNLNREHVENNTLILRKQNDINRLLINEVIIIIKLEKPEMNRQLASASRTQKLFSKIVIPQNILQLNNFRPRGRTFENFRPRGRTFENFCKYFKYTKHPAFCKT